MDSVSLHAHAYVCAVEGLLEELSAAEKRVHELERKRDHMVDSIFKSFCKQVGIKNIREYEVRFLCMYRLSAGVVMEVHVDALRARNCARRKSEPSSGSTLPTWSRGSRIRWSTSAPATPHRQ